VTATPPPVTVALAYTVPTGLGGILSVTTPGETKLLVIVSTHVAAPAAAPGAVVTVHVLVEVGACACTEVGVNCVIPNAAATTASRPIRPSLRDGFNVPSCDADIQVHMR
jgi:hypothetical protein